MGFFNKLFGSSPKGDNLEEFLNKADDALEEAIKLQNPMLFKDFCDKQFISRLYSLIEERQGESFGLADYRVRDWQISLNGSVVTAVKTVTHKPVQVTRTLTIPVATDTKENWLVTIIPEKGVVSIE